MFTMTQDEQRDVVARQVKEVSRIQTAAEKSNLHTGTVLCVCRRRVSILYMHRCYHCGIWFCPICCKEHFGERTNVPAHGGGPDDR